MPGEEAEEILKFDVRVAKLFSFAVN